MRLATLQFITNLVVMGSTGTILVLISRSLGRIPDEDAGPQKGSFLDRLLSSGITERADALLNAFLFKLIKRAKIIVMRADNFLGTQLKRVQHQNGQQGERPHFLKNLQKRVRRE